MGGDEGVAVQHKTQQNLATLVMFLSIINSFSYLIII